MPSKSAQSGFTVIELLVTAAIITVLSMIVLFQYTSFNGGALLTNQAYKIALDIREMQVFALGERIDGASARDEFGVEFHVDETDRYVRFRNGDGNTPPSYAAGGGDVLISESTLDGRFQVSAVRRLTSGGNQIDLNPGEFASVSFRRPNYDAIFGGNAAGSSGVEVVISTDDGASSRTITITTTGQITVQ